MGHLGWRIFMRRALLSLSLVALLGVLVVPNGALTQDAPAAPARTEEQLRALYTGRWNLTVSHAAGQAAIDRGIERAVTEMNYFIQGLARTQMHDSTPVNDRIDIAFPDGQITVVFDQRFTYTTRPGIAQDFPLPDGSTVSVRQYFRDGHLEQYFETGLGRRWSVYELSADGHTMTTRATQQGTMMPVPMAFSLDYRQ
jgi:hypothetical protein